ncbi:Hypp7391 [Branchiostoma lanceolatum]|uniref:Hypp7391 protein n=1 Tax=Branchiostoma lanceolatum TaxID=7740 RepID=A0A8K0E9U6_BRALA|nr:Hypp7391 [Branchiostoma lanceolatum]
MKTTLQLVLLLVALVISAEMMTADCFTAGAGSWRKRRRQSAAAANSRGLQLKLAALRGLMARRLSQWDTEATGQLERLENLDATLKNENA